MSNGKRKASQSPQRGSRSPQRLSKSPQRNAEPEKTTVDSKQWLCFVRHAQALHNVCDDNLWTPDNPLTPEGEKQCRRAREEWGAKVFKDAELIVSSPMTRALTTGFRLAGEVADKRWMVTPMCAEKLSGATCDEGTPKSEQVEKLPWMKDLQGFDELAEEWWTLPREEEELRVAAFLKFLASRKENKIVVVSHGAFLEYIVGYHMDNVTHHIMSMEQATAVEGKMQRSALNLNQALIKEYTTLALKALANTDLMCFRGVGRKKSAVFGKVGPKTVKGLANWKFARWAESICILAPLEEAGARDFSKIESQLNINKALDKEWEGYAFSDLLEAPVSAFEGLSQNQGKLLDSIGVKTIKDLGTLKYYLWSKAICSLAEVETPDGSS